MELSRFRWRGNSKGNQRRSSGTRALGCGDRYACSHGASFRFVALVGIPIMLLTTLKDT